jgi:Spy/CpxP family protein refolding chaperone
MSLWSIAMAAGLVGVLAMVKRLVLRRRFASDAGWGGGGCEGGSCRSGGGRGLGGWGRFGGRSRGIGRSFWLRALFARLDTTPGQEREIRAALEDLRDRARDAKTGLPETRANIGKAMAGDTFDRSALEAASARFDATAEKMKDAFASALQRIHGVLDPKQRERLAELVSSGFGPWGRGGFRGNGGPYRGSSEL